MNEEEARELLRREAANRGSFPRQAVEAAASVLRGGSSATTLPEVRIEGSPSKEPLSDRERISSALSPFLDAIGPKPQAVYKGSTQDIVEGDRIAKEWQAQHDARLSRPTSFQPEQPPEPGFMGAVHRVVNLLPTWHGGKTTYFSEPSPEQFQEAMYPRLKAAGLSDDQIKGMRQNSQSYQEFADAMYAQAFDKAKAEGRPIVRREKLDDHAPLSEKAGAAIDAVGSEFGAAATSALNTLGLGLPQRIGKAIAPELTARVTENERQHPIGNLAGEVYGTFSPRNLAQVGAEAVGGVARKLAPGASAALDASGLGRVLQTSAKAGVGGALGAGVTTAAEGGTAEESGKAALLGGGIGAGVGGVVGALGEGAGAARRDLRAKNPEIARVEAAGGRLKLSGTDPGEELGAIEQKARAAGSPTALDYQAGQLVDPLIESGTAELKGARAAVGRELERYTQTPEGQTPRPITNLLKAYTSEHAANIAGESGAPVAGANLRDLRANINNMADVRLIEPGPGEPFKARGGMRMSYEEAQRQGFDVATAAKEQLQNPEKARFMDVAVVPRRYNAPELLRAIDNIEAELKTTPDSAALKRRLAGALQDRDQFPGLSQLQKANSAKLGAVEGELAAASEQAPAEAGAFAKFNQREALFNNIKGYGESRYPARDEALRAQATKASQPAPPELPRPKPVADQGNIPRELRDTLPPEPVSSETKTDQAYLRAIQEEARARQGRMSPPPPAPGQVDYRRQLDLVAAVRALQSLQQKNTLNPFKIYGAGRLGMGASPGALRMRVDPLLEALMKAGVPIGAGSGTMIGKKTNQPDLYLF